MLAWCEPLYFIGLMTYTQKFNRMFLLSYSTINSRKEGMHNPGIDTIKWAANTTSGIVLQIFFLVFLSTFLSRTLYIIKTIVCYVFCCLSHSYARSLVCVSVFFPHVLQFHVNRFTENPKQCVQWELAAESKHPDHGNCYLHGTQAHFTANNNRK